MIRHICMFKLKEENKADNLVECVNRAQKLKGIPQVKKFQVVQNDKRTPESNYDLSLIFDFDSVEDLDAYQKAELHLEFARFVTSIRESRACIDYEF